MSDEKKMRLFFEALADNVEGLTDEELLAEVREDGRSPENIAAQTRQLLQNRLKEFKQRALVAAKKEHQRQEARLAAIKIDLPPTPAARRQLLDAVIAQHHQSGRTLTAQHRDFTEMTDEDVESLLQQFGALGLLDTKPESNE